MKYVILIFALLLSSCASMVDSISIGAGTGAAVGVVAGYAGNLNPKAWPLPEPLALSLVGSSAICLEEKMSTQ